MLSVSFKLRVIRDRLVIEVEGQPPAIVGRVVRETNGRANVVSANGDVTPLELEQIEGGLR